MSQEFHIIRDKNGHQPSVDDQVIVARTLFDERIVSHDDALKQDEIAKLLDDHGVELEYKLRTALDNLCSISVKGRFFPPGAKYVPISERRDEIIFDEVEETLHVDQAALLDHIQDDGYDGANKQRVAANGRGTTVRKVIADDVSIPPENVEQYLLSGDRDEQRERLNAAIDAIVDANDLAKRDDYGRIVFRHKAYRYWLL